MKWPSKELLVPILILALQAGGNVLMIGGARSIVLVFVECALHFSAGCLFLVWSIRRMATQEKLASKGWLAPIVIFELVTLCLWIQTWGNQGDPISAGRGICELVSSMFLLLTMMVVFASEKQLRLTAIQSRIATTGSDS